MKNIENYDAEKYDQKDYEKVEDGIYKTKDCYEDLYVTSLKFTQEPELGEGENASDISQYPLEDILDKFLVYISDFYGKLNKETSQVCYQEFGSPRLADIQKLRTIIGKHVFNKEVDGYITLVIE
jgi:hypothetical protein